MIMSEMIEKFCNMESKDVAAEIERVHAFFEIPVVPEYLTSEMLMSAYYRALGFSGMKGSAVLKNSRDLHRMMYSADGFTSGAFAKSEVEKLLKDVLLSPEDPTQKRSQKYPEYLFLAPIVPETALFSNPVRLTRNLNSQGGTPWNVERLAKILLAYCAKSEADSKDIWNQMFDKLSVAHDNAEDYFAQIIQKVLADAADLLRKKDEDSADRLPDWNKQINDALDPNQAEIYYKDRPYFAQISPLDFIRSGLLSVFALKPRFSRWQWLTMLDSLLRMSAVAFVIWLLDTHRIIYQMIQSFVFEDGVIDTETPEEFFVHEYNRRRTMTVFCYGEGSSKAEKRIVTDYGRDNIRLSFMLAYVRQVNIDIYNNLDWKSIGGFVKSLGILKNFFSNQPMKEQYFTALAQVLSQRGNDMNLKATRLRHLIESFRVLRQKIVVEAQSDFIRYDQSFLIHKKADYSTAPYIVDFGSVACFVIVYCCAGKRRVFSLKDFKRYLSSFYISVRPSHEENFTEQLKGFGLTMDSPDADDGLMIRNPFFEEAN